MKLNKIAALLCAAIMLISCLVPVPPAIATETAADQGTQTGQTSVYTYAVDVEFGNLSFYYDYGIWNVNTMRYEADATSTNPSVKTPAGFPGWYGFDGKSNRIAVSNSSKQGNTVYVTLEYRPFTEADYTSNINYTISGVDMTITDEAGKELSGNGGTFEVPVSGVDSSGNPIPVERYIHLSGTPKNGVGETAPNYVSANMAPIGMFSLTISGWAPKT